LGGYALPIIGAGVVGALIILAFVYVLRTRANAEMQGESAIAVPADNDQALVMEAKKTCTADDCDASYAQVSTLADNSPWRDSIDFRQIESLWADATLKRARAETDIGQKRLLLAKVAAAKTLDESHKKQLAVEISTLEQPSATPSQLPVATREVTREAAAPPPVAAPTPRANVAPHRQPPR